MPALIKTVILTASRDGRYCHGYVQGLLGAQQSPAFAGWIQMNHESDIARARGRLGTLGLERTQAGGFLFIDDDMHFTPEDFEAIIAAGAAGCAVVGGLYVKRRAQKGEVWAGEIGAHPSDPLIQQVREVGTGFLWIAREVLESLSTRVDRIEGEKSGWWHFFPAGMDAGQYVSEDYAFCRAAGAAGFAVWLHRGVRLGHEGKEVFTP